jgi:hypothetical protein
MLPVSSAPTQSLAALASAQVSSSLSHRGEHEGERNISGGDSAPLFCIVFFLGEER